ncbi:MAG: hypothetical protein IPL28_01110 [Chloroflexi bacterium]|nr:hypothetical protein [Chloroflexota bacterium]
MTTSTLWPAFPKIAVAEVVKTFEGSQLSSPQSRCQARFHLCVATGLCALSVGERQLDIAINYVEQQKEHHANQQTNKWLEMVSDLDEGQIRPYNPPPISANHPLFIGLMSQMISRFYDPLAECL